MAMMRVFEKDCSFDILERIFTIYIFNSQIQIDE